MLEQQRLKILNIANNLHKLRELVECSLCLKCAKNPIDIGCCHVFCEECFSNYEKQLKHKDLKCPVCSSPVNRRRKREHLKAKKISEYLESVNDKLKEVAGCNVIESPLHSVLQKLFGQRQSTRRKCSVRLLQKSKSPGNKTSGKTMINSGNSKKSSKRKRKSSNASCEIIDENTPTTSQFKGKVFIKNIPKKSEPKKDPFDLLLESTDAPQNSFLKSKITKTYATKHTPKITDNVLVFENDENKIKILQWLNDTRNKFDNLTQVKDNEDDNHSESESIFDLPSVSQAYKNRKKQVQENKNKMSKNDQIKSSKCLKKLKMTRAASLDRKENRKINKGKLKRHSVPRESQRCMSENIVESCETKKKLSIEKQRNLLEEECLKPINRENAETLKETFMKNDMNSSTTKVNENSDWNRLKSMRRMVRKVKKLNVSQCDSTPSTEKSRVNKTWSPKESPVKNNEKLKPPNHKIARSRSFNPGTVQKEDKTNDIPKVTNSIKRMTRSSSKLHCTFPTEENAVTNVDNTKKHSKKNEIISKKGTEKDDKNEKLKEDPASVTYDLSVIENYFSNNILQFIESNKLNDNKSVLKSVENIDEKNTSIKEKNKSKSIMEEKKKSPKRSSIMNKTIYDENEMQKTESAIPIENIENKIKKDYNSSDKISLVDDDMIFQPTQIFLENFENLSQVELKDSLVEAVKKFFEDIELVKQKNLEVNLNMLEPDLVCIRHIVDKIKNTKEEFKNFQNSQSQTEKIDQSNFSVQTSAVDFESVMTQTDPLNGFYISSNESFKTQIKVTTDVQTDEIKCIKCSESISNLNNHQVESSTKDNNVKGTDGYLFTQSLDNVNFETQDFLNQNSGKISQTISRFNFKRDISLRPNKSILDTISSPSTSKVLDKITILTSSPSTSKDNLTKNEENLTIVNSPLFISNIEKSQLAVSAAAQKDSPSGRRNVNQIVVGSDKDCKNKFKRTRISNSDNDSDSESNGISKKVCNKFLKDNLSINFDSQFDDLKVNTIREDKKDILLSCASDQVDFEEYLEKVMKRYEDTSTPDDNQNKTEDLVRKCDKMIKEAQKFRPQQKTVAPNTIKSPQSGNGFGLQTAEEFENEFRCTNSGIKKHENKFSESLFTTFENESAQNVQKQSIKNDNLNRQELDKFVKEVTKEFEESFDFEIDAELESLHKNKKTDSDTKIVIFQNLIFKNSTEKQEKKTMDMELVNENKDVNFEALSQKSGDLFDECDVIECTPQNKDNLDVSQDDVFENEKPPISLDQEALMDLVDMNFTPPPEFQDNENENDNTLKSNYFERNKEKNDNVTVESQRENRFFYMGISSLTPDLPIPSNHILVTKKLPETSTPNFLETNREMPISLSLSPVKSSQSQTQKNLVPELSKENPIEIAKKTKYSPLVVIKSKVPTPKPLPILANNSKQKSILNYTSQQASASIIGATKPNVCCSRLSKDQVIAINSLATKKIITYSTVFSPSVTHLIVTDYRGYLRNHTMKYVLAVASGIWILSFEWIEACLKENRIVSEESFEVSDVKGEPGPKKSRLTEKRDLLKGFKFYVAKPLVSTTKQEVESAITLLGGTICQRPNDLLDRNGLLPLIIAEARASQEFDVFEYWLVLVKSVTVDLEWLSRSVGQYQLLNLRPFTLCSEESILELGYPRSLAGEVSYSQSISVLS